MKAETSSEAELEKADAQAVMDQIITGKPLDPEVARRVHERAARITEEIRRTRGVINDETFQAVLADEE